MNKLKVWMVATCVAWVMPLLMSAQSGDSVSITLKNARRTVSYKADLVVDGKTKTLRNEDLTATGGNEIAVLVVNGGKLVLDHCTIHKTGDGVRTSAAGQQQGARPEQGQQQGARPEKGQQQGPRSESQNGQGRPDGVRSGQSRKGRSGREGDGNSDDSFNFYGLNSAVVAVGEGSTIEMKGCTVETDAEFANAVFACDDAQITISQGITIRTSRNSSRGLYATCAGVVKATGPVSIHTQGAHCAALATDRGGGTVVVGTPGTKDPSTLRTEGSGSPCIYSTGDILAYHATGEAISSQAMVVEGKNTITIEGCTLSGKSPKHGGVMLYQSTSGDAKEGTSVLTMKDCTLRDNSGTAMFLVTNTHSIVNIEHCSLLDSQGKPLDADSPLATCRDCNGDGHNWGRTGSNGGQLELNLTRQTLTGTLLANEPESVITVTADQHSSTEQLKTAQGNGSVTIR